VPELAAGLAQDVAGALVAYDSVHQGADTQTPMIPQLTLDERQDQALVERQDQAIRLVTEHVRRLCKETNPLLAFQFLSAIRPQAIFLQQGVDTWRCLLFLCSDPKIRGILEGLGAGEVAELGKCGGDVRAIACTLAGIVGCEPKDLVSAVKAMTVGKYKELVGKRLALQGPLVEPGPRVGAAGD
jgi:hypothetical protein